MSQYALKCDQPFCVHGFLYGPGGQLCPKCEGTGRILIIEKPSVRRAYRIGAYLIVIGFAIALGWWLGAR